MKREPEAVLEVCGLHIRRGNVVILDHVSWRVEPGQHWVILGAHGSRNASLPSALTGYLAPAGGLTAEPGQREGDTQRRDLRNRVELGSSFVRQSMPEFVPAPPVIEFTAEGEVV